MPGLTVNQTRSARGDDVGVITDGSSWTALLGVSSDNNLFADRDDHIDLSALRGLTVQDDIVFAALQVITYTVPAPASVMLMPGSPAIQSYAQIPSDAVPPAVRRTWIGCGSTRGSASRQSPAAAPATTASTRRCASDCTASSRR